MKQLQESLTAFSHTFGWLKGTTLELAAYPVSRDALRKQLLSKSNFSNEPQVRYRRGYRNTAWPSDAWLVLCC